MASLQISSTNVNATVETPCYHIHCCGLDAGEYLVDGTPAPARMEVVTLYQDATGARFAACTCTPGTIWGSREYACCPHTMAVWCFVQIHPSRIQERLDSLQRGAERMMRVQTPAAAMDARIAEIVTAIGTLRQREAATVRLVESVGARAPTLASADGDDLSDMAALFAPHPCGCGARISAEASACLDCDPGQYESDRLFDLMQVAA